VNILLVSILPTFSSFILPGISLAGEIEYASVFSVDVVSCYFAGVLRRTRKKVKESVKFRVFAKEEWM